MSLRHLNIAPRAFIGFAFIAVLVVLLGVFAVNRMTQMRQSSQDMSANQLPSMTHLGTITENVLRMRILSFRVLVNREPAALQEAETRIGVLADKVKTAQAAYATLPAGAEEAALYKTFGVTLNQHLYRYTCAFMRPPAGRCVPITTCSLLVFLSRSFLSLHLSLLSFFPSFPLILSLAVRYAL